MSFNVIAQGGLDIAGFGESRETLRDRLGRYTSFRRTPDDSLTDHFASVGLMLHFDESDKLNFAEVTPPAEVFYVGVSLLARNYHEVISDLSSRGIQGTEDGSGIEYSELGLALFNPAPEESESVVEGVSVFAPGYYS